VGAVVEGLTFYGLARLAAADMRVKVTFESLGRRKEAQLKRLEGLAGTLAKDAAPRPGIFPIDSVSKVECYVCGYVTETRTMPDQCPQCGTARYTFEKEVSRTKAWEIASEAARRTAALFRELAVEAGGEVRGVLEDLAGDEDAVVTEAEKELAKLRG